MLGLITAGNIKIISSAGNLGNVDYKYGLIEITDMDKFASTYKE